MFFIISNDLLSPENEIQLLMLARRYDEDRIFLEFSDQNAAENWVGSLAQPYKNNWSVILKNSIQIRSRYNIKRLYSAELVIKVEANISESTWGPVKSLTLDDAIALIDQGVKLGLENSRNDLSFLRTLLPTRSRAHLDTLLEKGHLEVLGGGIGELKKILQHRGSDSKFKALSWTLFDSDATYPGHTVQSTQEIIDTCEELGLTYHCLTRRAIENYISKEIYQLTHSGLNQTAEAIYQLSNVQLNHFNMKLGFGGSSEHTLQIYNDLTPEIVENLQRGLGKKFAHTTFSDHEKHDAIHESHKNNSTLDEFGTKLNHLANLLGRPA